MLRLRPLAFTLLSVACASGDAVNIPRTFEAYLAEVRAEMDAGLADLDAGDRRQLDDLYPVVASQVVWERVLGVLSERPAFQPLGRRMSRVIERRADSRIRSELRTPSGNRAVRDVLLESISSYLDTRTPPQS